MTKDEIAGGPFSLVPRPSAGSGEECSGLGPGSGRGPGGRPPGSGRGTVLDGGRAPAWSGPRSATTTRTTTGPAGVPGVTRSWGPDDSGHGGRRGRRRCERRVPRRGRTSGPPGRRSTPRWTGEEPGGSSGSHTCRTTHARVGRPTTPSPTSPSGPLRSTSRVTRRSAPGVPWSCAESG